MNRRDFLRYAAGGAAVFTMSGCRSGSSRPQAGFEQRTSQSIPSYLKGYESLYAADPRSAALEWFKDSRFGLFMHYELIRKIQPQTLISFKQGANGEEDFAAPERGGHSLAENVRKRVGPQQALIAQRAWQKNKDKHNELCNTLQQGGWGYVKANDGKHRGPEQVIKMLADARAQKCNLLLNTGPLPDGSIHTEDVNTLLEVGRRIRRDGWPGPEA